MSRVEIMSGWIHFFMIGVVLDPKMLEVKSSFSEHAWPADKHAQRRLRRFRPAPPVSAPHRGVVSEGTAASPPFFPSSLIFPAAGADACDGASRFAAVFAGTMGEACEAMFSNSLQKAAGIASFSLACFFKKACAFWWPSASHLKLSKLVTPMMKTLAVVARANVLKATETAAAVSSLSWSFGVTSRNVAAWFMAESVWCTLLWELTTLESRLFTIFFAMASLKMP